jgi:subtilisin family serine protease
MSVAATSIWRGLVVASGIAFGVLAAPAAAFVPNDPLFGQQWALDNIGQSIGGNPGTPDADIDAAEAWDVTTGSSAVTVAIVDDGVDPGQPDLVPNLDMASGFDFGDNDPDPIAEESGHGVQTALVLGARGNDGVGMAGVAWNVRIMPLKVRHAGGTGGRAARITLAAEEAAYRYAASHGARVVGASFGGTTRYSDSILQAIQSAPNTLWVVSAGNSSRFNSGTDIDARPRYPCSYPAANLICVGGSDNQDRLWTRPSPAQTSNFGATSVDLVAPASDIQTTRWNDSRTYALFSGTSYAAPQVSGAAALYLSKYPNATAADVKNAILSGVDVLPDFVGKTVTGGRLNIARTLSIPPAGGTGTPPPPGPGGDTTTQPKGPRLDPKVVLRLRRTQRLSDVLRKGIRVWVELPAQVKLDISLRLSRATAKRLRLATIVGRSVQKRASGALAKRVKLRKPAIKRLRHQRRVVLKVRLRATPTKGKSQTVARKVTLVRTPSKKRR